MTVAALIRAEERFARTADVVVPGVAPTPTRAAGARSKSTQAYYFQRTQGGNLPATAGGRTT